jgi:hypothetical protein
VVVAPPVSGELYGEVLGTEEKERWWGSEEVDEIIE